MSDILSNIGAFINSAISWITGFIAPLNSATAGNEAAGGTLLVFIVGVPLVGLGIGLLRRLIKTRG